jgi:PAS domain S-box-containing protein
MTGTGVAYAIAIAATLGVSLLRWLLAPALGDVFLFAMFCVPTTVAGYVGGARPALVATGLGVLVLWGFFLAHPVSWAMARAADVYGMSMFVVMNLAIAGMTGSLHRVQSRLRNAERLARERGETMRTTLESIGDGVVVTDAHGAITFMNHVAEALTGWTSGEAAGRPLAQVFTILDQATRRPSEDLIQKALTPDRVAGVANHTILVGRDGTERRIDNSAAPVRDDQGWTTGVVVIFRDITERRRAELNWAHLAAIVESTDDPIISKGLDGVVTSWNKAAERVFGYTAQEMVGQPISVLIPADRLAEEQWILQQIREGLRVAPFDTLRRRKDGTLVPVAVTVSPLIDADGRVVGASKIAHDITERHSAAEALREADRRKDEFLATLAHELRNPLAPIRSVVQVFEAAGASGHDLEWSRGVLARQVQIMGRLLDDLLDVSRISRNQLQIRRERVALAEVIQAAVETSRPLIESGAHQLAVSVPAEPIYVDADAVRLAQVFANLLNNAAKYTDPGGHITVTAEVRDADVYVSVRDDGIGVDTETLPHLFEIFSQGASAQGRSQGGLGIGLSLARSLLTLHGGSIEAHSNGPGTGSEFVVRLPKSTAAEAPASGPAGDDAGRMAQAPRQRVLVVDDSRDGADALARVLGLMGHDVSTAYDGEAGLQAAESLRPHLILLDIGMPKMDGYEVCRRIREQPWGRDLVLIALTGWGQREDRRRTEAMGFDHHLVKPVEPSHLQELLATLRPSPADARVRPAPATSGD